MKKINQLLTISAFVCAASSANAQQITGSSLFSPTAGGARILSAQGNTAANPAIGFQSSVSTIGTAENDGGGGNGIFRPLANTMAFSTTSLERMRITGGGNIGINTQSPLMKLHVHNGGIMISGATPSYGGPQLVFTDNVSTTPNGQWAIEYMSTATGRPSAGLNFWKPFGSTGGFKNYTLFLRNDGKVFMGATDDNADANFCVSAAAGSYRLYVNGGILTTKIKVANYCSTNWADYVFADDYQLMKLSELELYIRTHKHLPNIPSATEIEQEGLDLAQMSALQMEKIEELTLYLIEMEKRMAQLQADYEALKAQMAAQGSN